MRLHFLRTLFLFLFISCYNFVSAQYTIPPKPSVLYPIYDEVGLLSETEKQSLNEKLIKFEDSTSVEIEVIIIPSTKGEDINFVAWQFGEKWGIGKAETDNGIVLLIATEDRKISIQQGRSVEKHLTASVAGQIIDYIITPNFKQGLWYEGIYRGTTALMEAVQGQYKPLKKQPKKEGSSFTETIIIIFILIVIFSFIFSKNNHNDKNDDDVIISRRGRRIYPGGFFSFPTGGNFRSGRSSGGFGGFGGGGSFGGGGASGGW